VRPFFFVVCGHRCHALNILDTLASFKRRGLLGFMVGVGVGVADRSAGATLKSAIWLLLSVKSLDRLVT
jgi:hypothetical protein